MTIFPSVLLSMIIRAGQSSWESMRSQLFQWKDQLGNPNNSQQNNLCDILAFVCHPVW